MVSHQSVLGPRGKHAKGVFAGALACEEMIYAESDEAYAAGLCSDGASDRN